MRETILITTSSFDVAGNDAIAQLKSAGYAIVFNPFGKRLSEEQAISLFREHQPVGVIAGVEPLTEQVFAVAPKLRAIARCGTGLDSVDLPAASRRGIRVSNTPNAPTLPVAELALGLILNGLRRISESDRSLRLGQWAQLRGNLLSEKTVGIVGFGRIGRKLHELLVPFGCTILVTDPAYEGDVKTVRSTSFDELLTASDVVSLHMPVTEQTRGLFGRATFEKIKTSAILINVARGELIDEVALLDALRSKRIAGAALDVYEHEPYEGSLTSVDNIILTCHMGTATVEGRPIMEREAALNLLRDLNR